MMMSPEEEKEAVALFTELLTFRRIAAEAGIEPSGENFRRWVAAKRRLKPPPDPPVRNIFRFGAVVDPKKTGLGYLFNNCVA